MGRLLSEFVIEEDLCTKDSVELFVQIADAVATLHENKIVHRDIKPSNIMVTESDKAILMDFGLVKIKGKDAWTTLTGTDQIVGTPAFMAPEMLLGRPVDNRADIYQLGLLLYFLLTSELPFDIDNPTSIYTFVLGQGDLRPPTADHRLNEIVEGAIKTDVDERVDSARELQRFCEDWLKDTKSLEALVVTDETEVKSQSWKYWLFFLPLLLLSVFTVSREDKNPVSANTNLMTRLEVRENHLNKRDFKLNERPYVVAHGGVACLTFFKDLDIEPTFVIGGQEKRVERGQSTIIKGLSLQQESYRWKLLLEGRELLKGEVSSSLQSMKNERYRGQEIEINSNPFSMGDNFYYCDSTGAIYCLQVCPTSPSGLTEKWVHVPPNQPSEPHRVISTFIPTGDGNILYLYNQKKGSQLEKLTPSCELLSSFHLGRGGQLLVGVGILKGSVLYTQMHATGKPLMARIDLSAKKKTLIKGLANLSFESIASSNIAPWFVGDELYALYRQAEKVDDIHFRWLLLAFSERKNVGRLVQEIDSPTRRWFSRLDDDATLWTVGSRDGHYNLMHFGKNRNEHWPIKGNEHTQFSCAALPTGDSIYFTCWQPNAAGNAGALVENLVLPSTYLYRFDRRTKQFWRFFPSIGPEVATGTHSVEVFNRTHRFIYGANSYFLFAFDEKTHKSGNIVTFDNDLWRTVTLGPRNHILALKKDGSRFLVPLPLLVNLGKPLHPVLH